MSSEGLVPMSESLGTLRDVSRFPVKSMQGERLDVMELTPSGFLGDRAYALIEAESGKVLSGKTPGLGSRLLSCRASFVTPPVLGGEMPAVRITLPDDTVVSSEDPGAATALSRFLGTPVRLERSAPEDFTIDYNDPDLEELNPAEHRDTVIEIRLGAAYFAQAGRDSPLPVGSFLDLFPVSVISTSSLNRLGELSPESRWDPRRFRMNLVVDTSTPGFVENDWVGAVVQFGDAARIAVQLPDPRCVMTTLAQGDLPSDRSILRSLVRHNRLDVGGGLLPCVGVYAVVATPGTVRRGDPVTLA